MLHYRELIDGLGLWAPQFAGEPTQGPQKGLRLRQWPLPIFHEPWL